MTAIRERKRLDLVVELSPGDGRVRSARPRGHDARHPRRPRREVCLPVRPGRNMSSHHRDCRAQRALAPGRASPGARVRRQARARLMQDRAASHACPSDRRVAQFRACRRRTRARRRRPSPRAAAGRSMDETPALLVVTGVSGAGKSTAVNALEDLGYFCVDNLPPPVASSTIDSLRQAGVKRIALGIDVRVRGFLDDATRVLDVLASAGAASSGNRLPRRFRRGAARGAIRSTRRPHPLSTRKPERRALRPCIDGIRRRARAARGAPGSRELRARHHAAVRPRAPARHRRPLRPGAAARRRGFASASCRSASSSAAPWTPTWCSTCVSCRIRTSWPRFARCPAPTRAVVRYVLESPDARTYLGHMTELLAFCLPRFEREGRSYLTVGVGCTGGRHRSVVLADMLASAPARQARSRDRRRSPRRRPREPRRARRRPRSRPTLDPGRP